MEIVSPDPICLSRQTWRTSCRRPGNGPPVTAPGYTVAQTLDELRPMVDGAVRKYAPDTVKGTDEKTYHPFSEWHLTFDPPDYVMKGLIATGELWAVIAPPKATKSFLTIHLALSVALGLDWFGLSVKQGGVLLVCGERGRVQRRRGAALAKALGVTGSVPMGTMEGFFSLYKKESDVSAIIDRANRVKEEHGSCRMIVIDTLATVNAGADDVGDMPAMLAPLIRLREALPDTAIVVVHHSATKEAGRARGRSDFLGAVDGLLVVSKEADLSTVTLGAANDVSIPFDHSYTIESEEVGIDGDGDPITVGYLEPVQLTAVQKADRIYGRTDKSRMALLLRAHSQTSTEPLTKNQWLDAGVHHYAPSAEKRASRKSVLRRAMNDLIDKDTNCKAQGEGYRWNPFSPRIDETIALVFSPNISQNQCSDDSNNP